MTGQPAGHPVAARRERFAGAVFSVVTDEVVLPDGGTVSRDYLRLPGAVAVVALDDAGRVLLLEQYRHPVRAVLWELPAGMLDVPGESPLAAAGRELAEEGHVRADRWDLLVDLHTSPGISDETVRVYLARDLSEVPEADRYTGHGEEAMLRRHRVDLEDAVRRALAGEVRNGIALAGLLAAARCRDAGWRPLRPAQSPWPGPTTSG